MEAARSPTAQMHSTWHSPIPYLFGGLAAMLGLIAFALLILACSYWKLSGYMEGEGDRDLEDGEKTPAAMEEKIVVIMAGQAKPTYLATPTSSRSSSFGDTTRTCTSCGAAGIDKLPEMEKQSSSVLAETAQETQTH